MSKRAKLLIVITKPPYAPSQGSLGKPSELDFGKYGKCMAQIVQILGEGITYKIPEEFDFSFWKNEKVDVRINGKSYKDFLFI